jgi:thioredoxin 1
MPCRLVAPVLEEIAEEQAGRLIVAKLNVDDNPATAETYQVQSVPLMGVFSSGELVKSILGAWPKPAIMEELAEFFR